MGNLIAKLDTHFAMLSNISTYTVSRVGWYVVNGASRHMTCERKIFSRFQEQEVGMLVESSDDTMSPMKGLGSISFQMPFVLELDFVLYVVDLIKCMLSISCMTNLLCSIEFDGQQVTIKNDNYGYSQVLAIGMSESGLYKLLMNPIE